MFDFMEMLDFFVHPKYIGPPNMFVSEIWPVAQKEWTPEKKKIVVEC